jgi:hypothetical protein
VTSVSLLLRSSKNGFTVTLSSREIPLNSLITSLNPLVSLY